MDLSEIGRAAGRECMRQQVGLDGLINLLLGYELMVHRADLIEAGIPLIKVDMDFVRNLFDRVEPRTEGRIRRTAVTFPNGGGSCPPGEVREALARHLEVIPQAGEDCEIVDAWLTHFLWIHPCIDGNGRVGWILYNYLCKTLSSPMELPDYYGAQTDA